MLPATIGAARDELQESGWPEWHVNEIMRKDEARTKSLTQLIVSFGPCEAGNDSHRRLIWLTYFVARRVLPCWQIYCDTDEPQRAVKALGDWLNKGIQARNWDELSHVVEPSFQGKRIYDCRDCDTSAAAEAVAWAVRFLLSGQALEASYTVSEADSAFDQSPLGGHDEFRKWFCEVAVPVAYEQREMTYEEQRALRDFDPDNL